MRLPAHVPALLALLMPGLLRAEDKTVIPTIPDSSSEILSASRIFSFRILSSVQARPGPIAGMLAAYSEYSLTGVVLRRYKGELLEKEGGEFRATPLVYVGPIRSRPMGLWVGITAEDAPREGSVQVVFCRSGATHALQAGKLLSGLGDGCVVLPESTAADVELAIETESSRASMPQAIEALERAKARDPFYFVAYLFARYGAQVRALKDWRPLLALMADPSISRNLRYSLIHDLDRVMSSLSAISPDLRDAYLLALFRAACAYSEPGDQANLLETHVKIWIQGEAEPPPKASVLFKSAPQERRKALELVRRLSATPGLAVVERWLRS